MIPLSVLDLVPVREGGTVPQAMAETAALARVAEAAGYQRFWVAEHHGMEGIAGVLRKKAEEAKKSEEASKKAEEDAKKAAADEKRAAALRNENLKRMQGMAGATGDENAKGTALKSSGPSASYAGRIRARIKPNITFTDDVAGNPKAEVEVKTSPDGTILSRKLLSSSGNKAWDEAVLKAIDKTAVLPRDEDGRVPPVLEISFRPKD